MKKRVSRATFRERMDLMMAELRRDIADGRYATGHYLPSESALAKQYQLSNKSVRKGLEQLVEEGLIVKVNRVGNKVIGPDSRTAVTVTMGCSESIERDFEMQRLLAEFHERYPSVKVQCVPIRHAAAPAGFRHAVEPYLAGGIVDVMTMNHMNFLEFAENGLLDLLEPVREAKDVYPFLRDAFSFEGVLYVRPIAFSPVVLCYNRDHFRKADMPEPDSTWTWRDTIRAAERLARPGERHGIYFYLLSENRWTAFLLQSGEKFEWNEEGECDIRGTRLLESINTIKELISHPHLFPNYLTESSDDVNQLFIQGKVSMILSSYFSLNELKHTKVPYDISLLPYFDRPAVLTVPIGVAVARHSRQKEAAQLVANFFASHVVQQRIRELTVSIPACKPVAEQVYDEKVKINRPPHYAMFREHIPTFRLQKHLNLTTAQFHIVRSVLKKYWSGMIDEDVLCEEIKMRLRKPASRPVRA